MGDHLTAGDVQGLLQGGSTRAELKRALRHLLAGCAVCGEQLRPVLPLLSDPAASPGEDAAAPVSTGGEYDAPIARALAAAMSRNPRLWGAEREKAVRLAERLRGNGHRVMELTEEEAEEFFGVPFVEALLELSFEERYRDPREMLRLAQFARIAAENLGHQGCDPLHAADYQARAWAELGNAFRVNDDLKQAGAAFGVAQERLERGTGNLLVLARAADLQASLLVDQREFSDALALLDTVAALYRKVGDDHLAGRALVKLGIYTNYEGDPQRALGVLREGLALLDRTRDPHLFTHATASLLEVLVQCGELHEAGALLLKSGLRQALADEPLNLVTLRWVEGQVLAGLGKTARAESALLEARAGFREYRKEYKAAQVGLDLAEIWLRRGKKGEVRELAADMLATFRRLDIQREGQRAVEYLLWACDRERITPRTVGHVRRFLGLLERAPYLRFEAV